MYSARSQCLSTQLLNSPLAYGRGSKYCDRHVCLSVRLSTVVSNFSAILLTTNYLYTSLLLAELLQKLDDKLPSVQDQGQTDRAIVLADPNLTLTLTLIYDLDL